MIKENLDKYKHVNLAIEIKDWEHWKQIQPFTSLKYNYPQEYKKGFILYINNVAKNYADFQISSLDWDFSKKETIPYTYITSSEICINQTTYELW